MHLVEKNRQPPKENLGYYISITGAILALLWIGILKFTPTEAKGIRPLVENHPLSTWMYRAFSEQAVSNIVGTVELIVATLLLLSLRYNVFKKYAGIGMCVIFLTTLSYLFTTPNIWKTIDGVRVTDFFILKDMMYLGFGVTLLQSSLNSKNNSDEK